LDSASSVDLLATAPKDTVLAPNPSEGWTIVEPRRKSPKRNRVNSKGKEVIEVVVEPHILNSALPACPTVISSLGAVTSVGEDVASGNITIPAPPLKDLATGHRKSRLANPGNRKASLPPSMGDG
jgi:hypothetical protein